MTSPTTVDVVDDVLDPVAATLEALRLPAGQVVGPEQVERAIHTCARHIAHGVLVVRDREEIARVAAADYDAAYAAAYLRHDGPQAEKKQAAELATRRERDVRDVAQLALRHAERLSKGLDQMLRAYQSINKSVLATYGVAGVGER